jgi:tetratricopeptide (TPR) repeat protein
MFESRKKETPKQEINVQQNIQDKLSMIRSLCCQGQAYQRNGRFKEAIACYVYAIKVDNTKKEPWVLLGDIYVAGRCYSDAKFCYLEVLKIDGNCEKTLSKLADVCKKLGHINDESKCYEKLISINDQLYEAHLGLAVIGMKCKNHSYAAKYYKKVFQLCEGATTNTNSFWHSFRDADRREQCCEIAKNGLKYLGLYDIIMDNRKNNLSC